MRLNAGRHRELYLKKTYGRVVPKCKDARPPEVPRERGGLFEYTEMPRGEGNGALGRF